jgi:hypothetical protein
MCFLHSSANVNATASEGGPPEDNQLELTDPTIDAVKVPSLTINIQLLKVNILNCFQELVAQASQANSVVIQIESTDALPQPIQEFKAFRRQDSFKGFPEDVSFREG